MNTRRSSQCTRGTLAAPGGEQVLRIRSGAIRAWRLPRAATPWCADLRRLARSGRASRRRSGMTDNEFLLYELVGDRLREARADAARRARTAHLATAIAPAPEARRFAIGVKIVQNAGARLMD